MEMIVKNYFFVSYYLFGNEKRTQLVKAKTPKKALKKFFKKNNRSFIENISIETCIVEILEERKTKNE